MVMGEGAGKEVEGEVSEVLEVLEDHQVQVKCIEHQPFRLEDRHR